MAQKAYFTIHSDGDCQDLSSKFLSCPLAAVMVNPKLESADIMDWFLEHPVVLHFVLSDQEDQNIRIAGSAHEEWSRGGRGR